MQDERSSAQENDDHTASLRTHEPSAEQLKRITEFVVGLDEPYRTIGLTAIAEHLVSCMKLHFLDIMATFQQKAEQEGIDAEERECTFEDILPKRFPVMMGLSKRLTKQSLDDLTVLSNVTIGLYGLSQSDSAEEAQSWMYELSTLYPRRLAREGFVINIQTPKEA